MGRARTSVRTEKHLAQTPEIGRRDRRQPDVANRHGGVRIRAGVPARRCGATAAGDAHSAAPLAEHEFAELTPSRGYQRRLVPSSWARFSLMSPLEHGGAAVPTSRMGEAGGQ